MVWSDQCVCVQMRLQCLSGPVEAVGGSTLLFPRKGQHQPESQHSPEQAEEEQELGHRRALKGSAAFSSYFKILLTAPHNHGCQGVPLTTDALKVIIGHVEKGNTCCEVCL
ncbi:hypothetical protein HPB50_017534 [Hyalomma asiaticum]|uniref:Uncharacterized protein n=1 Tax=Hyalomma asiaticum TaxID=266040 RepID=A0ACB7RWZ4_HYAAI|nr:hypothetical protein HPB50_017534 [Hyalomma asiaticum]